jgi:phosphoribosylcarboxyaminoimidazole (NCAIR) mutase
VSDETAQYVKRKLGKTFALEFNSVARTVVARRRSSQLSALSRQRSKTPPFQNSTTPLKFPPSALRLPPSISRSHGCIAILAAGTADVRVAEEAAVSAEAMGCRVLRFYDVGIAGLHRLLEPIRQIQENQVACVVACAGMEGALPSVVRGLIAIPVIGVPVSTGYGYGGKGQAALMTMLQSCSPGLTVVNIDNGFGAGATAALIAKHLIKQNRKEA